MGSSPVESDIYFHFKSSFLKLNYDVIDLKWKIDNGIASFDMLESINTIENKFTNKNIIIFSDINNGVLLESSLDFELLNFSHKLKILLNAKIITFIGDFYYTHNFKKLTELLLDNSDLLLSPYKGSIDLLKIYFPEVDTSKIVEIVFLPTVMSEIDHKKIYDITYLGSPKSSRIKGLIELLEFFKFVYINTGGRKPSEFNPSRNISSYMNSLNISRYSINSAAVTIRPISKIDNSDFQIFQPPALPGRIAESISCYCIPIYFKDEFEILPEIMINNPLIITIAPSESKSKLMALASTTSTIESKKFIEFHENYLSPEAILLPLIKKLQGY